MWGLHDNRLVTVVIFAARFLLAERSNVLCAGRQKKSYCFFQVQPFWCCQAGHQGTELENVEDSFVRTHLWLLYAVWSINWRIPMSALLRRHMQRCRCVHKNVNYGPQPNGYEPKLLSNVKPLAFRRTLLCNLWAESTTVCYCNCVRRK